MSVSRSSNRNSANIRDNTDNCLLHRENTAAELEVLRNEVANISQEIKNASPGKKILKDAESETGDSHQDVEIEEDEVTFHMESLAKLTRPKNHL